MNDYGREACQQAVACIGWGDYEIAIRCLRDALRCTTNRRAWSKLMLAIRELSRIAPTADRTS